MLTHYRNFFCSLGGKDPFKTGSSLSTTAFWHRGVFCVIWIFLFFLQFFNIFYVFLINFNVLIIFYYIFIHKHYIINI